MLLLKWDFIVNEPHMRNKTFANTVNVLKFCTSKCLYTNIADPDQTAPWSSLIWVYTVCYSTKYFKKELHKKQNFGQKSME